MPDYWLLWHHRIRSKVPFDTRSQPFASHLAIRTSQQDPRTAEHRSEPVRWHVESWKWLGPWLHDLLALVPIGPGLLHFVCRDLWRSEEHTSELQSHLNLVCRLLLEKKKTN